MKINSINPYERWHAFYVGSPLRPENPIIAMKLKRFREEPRDKKVQPIEPIPDNKGMLFDNGLDVKV